MHSRSWVEIALLAVAMAASGYGFWWSFGKVAQIIRSSKKDPGFKLAPLGPRITKFIWEVLLQGPVIQQRPLPGLAHASVFWGFSAFALVTLNHFALGFGFELLSPVGFFGRIYFFLAALFAVAVAVSITGLAIRRFLVRPKWLGKEVYESGFIAFLIFMLVVTYLAG